MQYDMAYVLKLRKLKSHEKNCMRGYDLVYGVVSNRTDYVGISVLIAASILTVEYHGFYCQPIAQVSYMASTAVLGIIGMCIPWLEWFDQQYLPQLPHV